MRPPSRRSAAGLVTVLLSAGLAGAGQPAAAADPSSGLPTFNPAGRSAAAADRPASLIVGLRPGADAAAPVERLDADPAVDVVDTAPVTGAEAVTVDVAAADRAEAVTALREDPDVAYVEENLRRSAADVSVNDALRPYQWGLDVTGTPAAWDITTGSGRVVVAVLDTGVTAVPELAGALLPGYDFVNRDSNPADDNEPGHGTLVASVLTAGANNTVGGAGVCWTCRIMPVKVLDRDGFGYDSEIAAGIRWAADRGAHIINMSLSGPGSTTVLRDAVAYAVSRGVLVVASAGNDRTTEHNYPAAYPSVVAVAGSQLDDTRHPRSNYGDWVDVAAPWTNIGQDRKGQFWDFTGTSSAAPIVAGVAALVKANSPEATAAQISQALLNTARPVGSWVQAGRVDAFAAVQHLPANPNPRPSVRVMRPLPNSVVKGTVIFGAVLPADAARMEVLIGDEVVATDTAPPWRLEWNSAGRNGAVTAYLRATDTQGDASTVTLPLTVDNTLPTVSFKSPASGAYLRGTVNVTANAGDNVGLARVELLVGGKVVATDTAAPWSLPWRSGNGQVTLTLRAVDRAGNARTVARTVTGDNTAPALTITSAPKNGARVSGPVTVKVKATDRFGVARVQVLVNGKVAATDTTSPYALKVKTGLYGKTLKVKVRAYDRAGNVRTSPVRTWYR